MGIPILILGGTSEGRALGERLLGDARFEALVSYAGRTAQLAEGAFARRVGGFGGVAGLAEFLRRGRYAALVDATHPFAAQISANAVHASRDAGVPLLRIARPAFGGALAERCEVVPDMPSAVGALGASPRRVLLTIGKQEVSIFRRAPQHHYLVRAIDPFDPGLPDARVLCARGPFRFEDERALLLRERIELLVTKDAGGAATSPKLAAAAALGLRVIMVQRPTLLPAQEVNSVDEALNWLAALHASQAPGGV